MSVFDQLHKGMVIRCDNNPHVILDYAKAQTGKQKATIHVKLRNLHTGHTTERTLDQLGGLDEVPTEMRNMQYLYAAGETRVFMDTASFEQYELGPDVLGDALEFLVEEETYRFLTIEGQPASLKLPDVLVMEVVDTAPVEHAGGATNVTKEAVINCGLTVRVPLFIKNGDRIRLGTEHKDYQGKEH